MRRKLLVLVVGWLLLFSCGALAQGFDEAPMLKELVERGELPPVDERVPLEPYVVEPVERIGVYGGTARTAVIGSINGIGDDTMMMSAWTDFIQAGPRAEGYVPHLAKGFEPNEDYTVWTLYMREGVRWSDGHPLTSDDLMFWWEDIQGNEELTPNIGLAWRAGGEIMNVAQVDDYTVEFQFAAPKPYFPGQFIHRRWGALHPKHYMEQFHPHYVPREELTQMAQDAGFDHWYQLFNDKAAKVIGIPLRTELPTLAPYQLVRLTSDRRIYERNPYFWKVDTAGNQLPYIDRIETTLVADSEVYQAMIMAGQLDFAAFGTEIQNFPMYSRFEEEGDYRTVLWKSGHGNEVIYFFALTHREPAMREIFQDVRFRRALSVAINRDELNDVIYFGRGTPMQYTVLPTSVHYQQEFADSYTQFDPDLANRLLDEMGLDQRDSDGWRLRPDGERLRFTIEFQHAETDKLPNVELVTAYWREVGIDMTMESISGELIWQRGPGNLLDVTVWHGSAESDLLFPAENNFILPIGTYAANINFMEWSRHYLTQGREGEEPPTQVAQLIEWYDQVIVESDPDVRDQLTYNILRSQAENLWAIGTIGEAPYPIIVNNAMRNVPTDGFWGWEAQWTTNRDPEQFFFDR